MKFLTSILMCLLSVNVYAGFGLEGTRVIYNENAKNSSIVAFSTEGSSNYLIQSWISNLDNQYSNDFIITPPLFKLDGGDKATLRISKMINLPDQQESVYWINVKFIAPEKKDNLEVNKINYSLTNQIKLIYRPKGLATNNIEKEIDKVQVSKQGSSFVVNNPTPYYMHIGMVKLNDKDQQKVLLVAPNSRDIIQNSLSAQKLTLYFIGDLGNEIKKDYSP